MAAFAAAHAAYLEPPDCGDLCCESCGTNLEDASSPMREACADLVEVAPLCVSCCSCVDCVEAVETFAASWPPHRGALRVVGGWTSRVAARCDGLVAS